MRELIVMTETFMVMAVCRRDAYCARSIGQVSEQRPQRDPSCHRHGLRRGVEKHRETDEGCGLVCSLVTGGIQDPASNSHVSPMTLYHGRPADWVTCYAERSAHRSRVSCSSVITMLMLCAVSPEQNWSGFQLRSAQIACVSQAPLELSPCRTAATNKPWHGLRASRL